MIENIFWVFSSSALPILEIRGAIPLGVFVFKMNPVLVYFVALLGNFLIVPFLLIFLKRFSEFLMGKWYFFNRLLTFVFSRTRNKSALKFEKWGHWALYFLVAIPLPLTGAWTGSVAAFLFGVPFKRSLFTIFLGIMTAGLIVLLLSCLGIEMFTGQ